MDLGPSCPIPDCSSNNPSRDELDLTAQEIEWRRWAEWQKQKSGRQFLKKLRSLIVQSECHAHARAVTGH